VHKRSAIATIGILGAALLFAACGSGKNASSSSSSSSSENTFGLSEFTVIPPTNRLHSGRVTITANNLGGEVHELVIVRAASADALATRSDGSVDEDKVAAADKVGEIEDVAGGSRKSKALELSAGTYVAFCNIVDEMMGSSSSTMHDSGMGSGSGHVHFSEGMHVTFTVS
jgi:hypothetical protein